MSEAEGGVSTQRFAEANSFMVAVTVAPFQKTLPRPHVLVVAPEGATTVRLHGITAQVHHRLAVVIAGGGAAGAG